VLYENKITRASDSLKQSNLKCII